MKKKDRIGMCRWSLKTSLDSYHEYGAYDGKANWSNPNTHPSELCADMRDSGFEFLAAECHQWQKGGRRIEEVVIARFVLSLNGKWKAVGADAQPIETR